MNDSLKDRQQQWITTLQRMAQRHPQGVTQDLFLARNHSREVQAPKAWVNADIWSWDWGRCDFRTLNWNCLCCDVDFKEYVDVYNTSYRICYLYKYIHAPHYIFPTAGKGLHISMFLDAGNKEQEVNWSDIRMGMYNWIRAQCFFSDRILDTNDPKWNNIRMACFHYLQSRNLSSKFTEVFNYMAPITDVSKISWGDSTLGSMLRCEGGIRWKKIVKEDGTEEWKKLYKGWVFSLPPKKIEITEPWNVLFPPVLKEFKVPQEVLDHVREVKEEKEENRFPKSNTEILPCIKRLMERVMVSRENLTHFARLAIVSHLLRKGWPKDKICEVFQNSPDYDAVYTAYQVNHIAERKYIPPGCKKIQLMCCCPGRCPFVRD